MAEQTELLQGASSEDLARFLEDDATLPESQRRWPPELAAMLRVMEATLVRRGFKPALAFEIAADQVTDLATYRGGRMLYLPQGQRLKLALRDALIWREFTGNNHRDLAETHKLSVVAIYEILREQRALNTRKLQGQLFDDKGEEK